MATRKSKAASPAPTEPLRIPIEELSRRSGFTVRNIREMQRRSLVTAPELEGRKGFYGDEHLTRLALVRRMQDRGYSLSSIEDLLRGWQKGRGIDEVVGMGQDLLTRVEPAAERMEQSELIALFPELQNNLSLRKKAEAVELLVESGAGFYAPNSEYARLVSLYTEAGVPLDALLSDMAETHADVERIMSRARASFVRHLFSTKNNPERPREITSLVAKLRPATVRLVTLMAEQAAQRGAPLPAPSSTSKASSDTPRKPNRKK